ncbi:MAG: hypothetical protein BWY70_01669 [Bacteroidetes bacterium ADurb.Bin408]|nr:MAG: hypothetical protein BWY70_01669 [Bacteroidetes bacterium ADurb.Bin408]
MMLDKRGLRMHMDSNKCLTAAKNKGKREHKGTYNKQCDAVGFEGSEHVFRLLNANVPEEANAIEQGFYKVCINCLELA